MASAPKSTSPVSLFLLAGVLLFLAFFGRLLILGFSGGDTINLTAQQPSTQEETPAIALNDNVFKEIHTHYPGYKTPLERLVRTDIPFENHNPVIGPHNAPINIVIFHDMHCTECRIKVAKWHTEMAPFKTHIRTIYKFMPQQPKETTGGVFEQIAWRNNVFKAYLPHMLAQKSDLATRDYLTTLERVGISLQEQQRVMQDDMPAVIDANAKDSALIAQKGLRDFGTPLMFINGYQLNQEGLPETYLPTYIERLKQGLTIIPADQ